MPVTLINSSTSTQWIAANNNYLLPSGAVVSVDSPLAVFGPNLNAMDLTISGAVISTGEGVTVHAADSLSENWVTVAAGGTVFGESRGILGNNGTLNIENHGTISSDQVGIDMTGGAAVVQNYGSIVGTSYGLGILVDGQRSVNYGTISGGLALILDNWSGGLRFDNFGTLIGTDGTAVDGFSTGSGVFRNFGVVTGDVVLEGGSKTLLNHGTITGNAETDVSADVVKNFGLIDGDVRLGGGADIYREFGGTVTGTVFGDWGDDRFYVYQAGVAINGGTEYDTVHAWTDFASGGEIERIVLRGTGGIDGTGDAGANRIDGNSGNNEIAGLGGNDTLFGGKGDDVLNGGDENDILRGGANDDTLIGGTGADVLYGGAGADVFVFETLADSGIDAARDQIRDFARGEDLIDISDLSDPAFTFEGTSGLSGTGPSVAYFVNGNGRAVVEIDVDGDGVRDMQITVFDNAVLSADDFVL